MFWEFMRVKSRVRQSTLKVRRLKQKLGGVVYKKVLKKTLVIDDETYVPADHLDVPGRKFYHATNPKELNYNEKVKPKAKYVTKYLVWNAMDENGNLSEPFISESTINGEVYLQQCIKKRLMPFIRENNLSNV